MSDARAKPGCLLAAGLFLTIGAVLFTGVRWIMGFGSAVVARSEAEADAVLQSMVTSTAGAAVALLLGLALAIGGVVGLVRRRQKPA